ncbi:SRPBCC domain-containing protein [Streptomyces sp. ACA25]|uniref:SRPBCC family protein n=1 Tax=Streptomyces sp. ACA25 TaxID=3022596 RepID=UPI00230785EA|nr:SRPBCC domain-containing protein [Streptomyces sp. ACA25]MDB1087020.1 SRPBCC domain-containing protein [Streptomyces sp. ACA25]
MTDRTPEEVGGPPEPERGVSAEFTLTRVFDAPRELVFRAWTDPDQLAGWWGPQGFRTPPATITSDAREGGEFALTMVHEADGAEYPVFGVFREVRAPERLVVTTWSKPERGVGEWVATVTFADLGDGRTEMTFHTVGVTTEGVADQARTGWSQSFDKLAGHLAGNGE